MDELPANLCQPITPENINELLASVDAVFFDFAGTLWRGEEIFDGALSFITRLLALGKRVGYVSNHSTKTQAGLVQEINRRGFPTKEPDLVMSTVRAAAIYLSQKLPGSTVFLVTHRCFVDELNKVGIKGWIATDMNELPPAELLEQTSAVVCGLDRSLTYRSLSVATHLLLTKKSAPFVAANLDPIYPESGGRFAPECGSLCAALTAASGRQPDIVIGKPSGLMFEQIADRLNLDRKRVLVVGDRCKSDMAFASSIGARSLLVLTGNSDEAEAKRHAEGGPACRANAPHFIAPSVGYLNKLLGDLMM